MCDLVLLLPLRLLQNLIFELLKSIILHKLYVEIDFFPGIQFRNQNTKRLGDFEINRLPSTGCQELYSFCKQFAIRMLKMISHQGECFKNKIKPLDGVMIYQSNL